MDAIINLDTSIFYFFNKTCHLDALNNLMIFITNLGDGVFIFIVALSMMIFRKRRVFIPAILLLAGLTISHYAVDTLKDFVARPRPFASLPDVNAVIMAKNFSFPSGHTAIAFMAAFILTRYFGRWYIFYPLALLVAVSRVYLGVHFPLDVIAGGCIGSIVGYFLVRIAKSESKVSG